MKVSLNRLKQYVDCHWSAEELTERLTQLGLEVEGVQKLSAAFDGIVVAHVISRDPHPNADKLSLCRVDDGKGQRQIVCGAHNFKAGDKVPLILPGASLPLREGQSAPLVIKTGKIRGLESQGMLCSPEELGIEPQSIGLKQEEGLLLLRPDAKVGQPFAEYLGRSGGDVVYDLEITPNRPDLNSVIGIAREIAAVTGAALRLPTPRSQTSGVTAESLVAVRVEEPGLCRRYVARVIQGVRVGPSPEWLRSSLEKVGVRSINNLVDVTNFVMLETGQPLHAFDLQLIAPGAAGRPTLVVRRALAGEKFETLDHQVRTLTAEMLLIADEKKGIALAGIMGGANTEISAATTTVVLESANFTPTHIRRASRQLGLRSESSYRFERGADVGICDWASQLAAQLILETAGGQLAAGAVEVYPEPAAEKTLELHFAKSKDLLGIGISHAEQIGFLTRLGLPLVSQAPGVCTVGIPTWRVDLKREVDLIEEVGRLFGVDQIPSTPPRGALGAHPFDTVYDQIGEARRILTGLGLNEAQGQTLVARADCRVSDEQWVALANPLSHDMDGLRPSLLPGLIQALGHNVARKNPDVGLFEIGRVFTLERAGEPRSGKSQPGAGPSGRPLPREERRVALALTGQRCPSFWSGADRGAKFDASDLKGLVEDWLEQFGLRGLVVTQRADSTPWFLESAEVTLGGKVPLGEMGQLLPLIAKRYDLREAVFLAEFNLDLLLAKRQAVKSFKPLPSFPAIGRDVAMVVAEKVTHEAVLQTVRQARPAHLESMELFDVFRGPPVPAGHKSLAYAFTYRALDRTLTDTEVNLAHDRVVAQFQQQLGAAIR